MSLWLAAVILVVANAVAVTTMLGIRRRAPTGSYFRDTQQAAGAFAVAGTTLAVLVAFTFLLAFQSYTDARGSAEDEATAVASLFHTAEFFPAGSRDLLQADLVCYGRAVIDSEWLTLRDGRRSPLVTRWASVLERHFERVHATGEAQGAAAQNWFQVTDERQKARSGRIAEAAPLVPALVWLFLLVGGALVIGFLFFFADSRERRLSQAAMIVVVTTLVVTSLIMVQFLDSPYEGQSGSIEPVAMRQAVQAIEAERVARHDATPAPCVRAGRPARA